MPLQRMDVVADTACPAGYDVIEDRPEIKLVNRIRTRFVKIRLRFSRAPKARAVGASCARRRRARRCLIWGTWSQAYY